MTHIFSQSLRDNNEYFNTCYPPIIKQLRKVKIDKKTIDKAREIFLTASKRIVFRGRDRLSFVYMSIYTSAVQNKLPIKIDDFKTPKKPNLTMKNFMQSKKLIDYYIMSQGEKVAREYDKIIQRYCEDMRLTKGHCEYAIEMYNEFRKKISMTKGLLPTIMYITAATRMPNQNRQKKSQKYVSRKCDISEVSIRNRLRIIKKKYQTSDLFKFKFWE
jgi:transcription initiation factor TFIIIB Brf1 subunit/transcription initiation factor TFIIB